MDIKANIRKYDSIKLLVSRINKYYDKFKGLQSADLADEAKLKQLQQLYNEMQAKLGSPVNCNTEETSTI